MSGRRWWSLCVVVVASACIDLSTDPDEIVAIEFGELPWPSVVAGDTLRDAAGVVAPLVARLFDAEGQLVTGGSVEFLARDTTVTIAGGNLVIGRATADGLARLLASGAGLQSIVRQLEVVPRPDSLAAGGAVDTLRWVVPDAPITNTSGTIGVRVLSGSGTAARGVRSWIVRFRLEFRGEAIADGDTTRVFLVNESGRPSGTDTTDAQGAASRRLRVRTGPLIPTTQDSVIVFTEVRHRGSLLLGAPVRLALPIAPRG